MIVAVMNGHRSEVHAPVMVVILAYLIQIRTVAPSYVIRSMMSMHSAEQLHIPHCDVVKAAEEALKRPLEWDEEEIEFYACKSRNC